MFLSRQHAVGVSHHNVSHCMKFSLPQRVNAACTVGANSGFILIANSGPKTPGACCSHESLSCAVISICINMSQTTYFCLDSCDSACSSLTSMHVCGPRLISGIQPCEVGHSQMTYGGLKRGHDIIPITCNFNPLTVHQLHLKSLSFPSHSFPHVLCYILNGVSALRDCHCRCQHYLVSTHPTITFGIYKS